MELGLSLGGGGGDSASADVSASAPLNKSRDLSLALGVNPLARQHREGSRSGGDPTVSTDSPHLRLNLFPLWSPHETVNSGSSEGDSGEAGAGGGEHQGERTSSRASDEDENGHIRKKLRLSKDQAAFLEESFKQHNTLNPKQKQALAKQLNLRPRQVEVWFQNRRARTKLKQTEVDCEYLKRCCETLTEENRRLHKELQELRALKSSNPYYMQQPATTLTMCPSCKCTTTTTTTAATISANASSQKASPFALSRPKFFPFSSHNNQSQKSEMTI